MRAQSHVALHMALIPSCAAPCSVRSSPPTPTPYSIFGRAPAQSLAAGVLPQPKEIRAARQMNQIYWDLKFVLNCGLNSYMVPWLEKMYLSSDRGREANASGDVI